MANLYFTLAHQEGAGREGQGKRTGGMGFMQRIMHRTNSCYPLPCDDQEQQVSRGLDFAEMDAEACDGFSGLITR